MKISFSVGDLVRIGLFQSSWTIIFIKDPPTSSGIREIPASHLEMYSDPLYNKSFIFLEGKMGLIVSVIRNRLGQATAYRIMVDGIEMFCKSLVAYKYFRRVRGNNHERGGCSTV